MGLHDNFRLDGKVAVVTGGGRGIGRGIALGFAESGADVVVIARRQEDVDAVAKEVEARGQRGLGISADVMDWDSIPEALDRVVDEFGGLDIMVNNAGGNLDRKMWSLPDISIDKFDEQLHLNMKTKFWGSQQAAKRMTNGGRIINIISIAAHKPSPGFGVYSAANMGMISMTRTLAVELAPKQITVNCIAPGIIVTDMLRETMNVSDEQAHEMFDDVIPLGRTGTPEDCAAAALLFASPAGAWITGQYIDVAGGQPT
ncbi:MAG: SDR family oxidoreductase [Pseudomonadales bacterium]|nr:SDR family oxidoreductase [Pseudomonadales bacterium]MBO6565686.1 SDR family oxidoreductase [Pseudomonadales bacterium]MBO6595732.1 SDR family oxidoreductase [Pseudomonadales bacterium]MBO6820710.1 SDR family oxidoreductase [Pseudomonadales bacterium]